MAWGLYRKELESAQTLQIHSGALRSRQWRGDVIANASPSHGPRMECLIDVSMDRFWILPDVVR